MTSKGGLETWRGLICLLILGAWAAAFGLQVLLANENRLPPIRPRLSDVNRRFVGETRAFLEDLKVVAPELPADGLIVVMMPEESWDLPWYGYDWVLSIVDGLIASPALFIVFEPDSPTNGAFVAEGKLSGAIVVASAALSEDFAAKSHPIAQLEHLSVYRID